MTATLPHPASTVEPPVRRRRSRRWLRFVLPFAVIGVFWGVTGAAHFYEEPNRSDAGTLAPGGTGRHGSSRLADLLTRKGINIQRVTSSQAVTPNASGVDATIFVPSPDFLVPGFLPTWIQLPGRHRIVVVQPGLLTTFTLGQPIGIRKSRWATGVASPGCSTDYAQQAGPATIRHDVYEADRPSTLCYGGSLVGLSAGDLEVVYVGATEPFRNDRIAENGNAALATALLGRYERVIWVDVHAREPVQRPDITIRIPDYERDDQNRTDTGNPAIDAFPAPFWAVLILLGAGAFLLALARARRLGPPVAEPLPVLVPAAEAVTGRGRLYQRISARGASLDALRVAAIARLHRVVDPFAGVAADRELSHRGPAAERFVAQLAARTGWAPADVMTVLYGRPPGDDEELQAAVARLDLLVHIVTTPQGGTP